MKGQKQTQEIQKTFDYLRIHQDHSPVLMKLHL